VEKHIVAPGIFIYKNVLPESKDLIKEIEDCVDHKTASWTASAVRTSNQESINKFIRDTDSMAVPYLGGKNEDYQNFQDAFYKTLNNVFFEAFTPCEQEYKSFFGIETEWHDQWGILKYGVGQHFSNHIDDSIAYHRRISTLFYMNDDYTGGEINFPSFNLSIKPEANDFILFPSIYTYNHSVSPVVSGTRYSVVSWLR